VVRSLTRADTWEARSLLRGRPLHNLFLDSVIAAGVLGRVPGFLGFARGDRLRAILLIGPLGGTALEVQDAEAFEPLAAAAAAEPRRPRHIVGSEDVTVPFWRAYAAHAPPLRWSRREPVMLVGTAELGRARPAGRRARIELARERDLSEVALNSAEQHREDLRDERAVADWQGFLDRHAKDLRAGRWWVVRERGRIAFQAHVGATTADVVQIGGVFVPPDLRLHGHATRGVRALTEHLLDRHPRVTLYCDETNAAARRVYDRVGFRPVFCNQSYLLEEPAA
jgi:RimJ/RimL family protein N-acetyltransferase